MRQIKPKFIVQHRLLTESRWSDLAAQPSRFTAFAVRDAKRIYDRKGLVEYRVVERTEAGDTVIERMTE